MEIVEESNGTRTIFEAKLRFSRKKDIPNFMVYIQVRPLYQANLCREKGAIPYCGADPSLFEPLVSHFYSLMLFYL